MFNIMIITEELYLIERNLNPVASQPQPIISIFQITLISGDKVIYSTTGTAPSGMVDQEMYYIIRIDSNNVKLASSKVNALGIIPEPIEINGFGSGEHFLSFINPVIEVVKGNTVSFATTDSSLSFVSSGSTFLHLI